MPLEIRPSTIIKTIFFGLIPILLLIGFFITGYQYIPVEYTVGKCMKDYTNAVSYSGRSIELQTTKLNLENADALLCYSRPSTQNQNVFGDEIPFDQIWEFGTNEPTRLYTNRDLVVGEVVVPKGRYSIYAIPGRWKWEVFVSKSTKHWGDSINEEVRSQEIGSFEVKPEYNAVFVRELTFKSTQKEIIAEWGKTRIRIPIENIDSEQEVKHTTIISKFLAS